jgi:hypothetical protein
MHDVLLHICDKPVHTHNDFRFPGDESILDRGESPEDHSLGKGLGPSSSFSHHEGGAGNLRDWGRQRQLRFAVKEAFYGASVLEGSWESQEVDVPSRSH